MGTVERVERVSVRGWRKGDARVWGMIGAVVLIAVLARPMVIGRTFVGWDWYSHQWYIWHQAGSLKANGLPSLYAYSSGAFSPVYAFYGGTMYVLAGLFSFVVGNPGSAMVIMFVLGFAAAYGGWYWLAFQVRLRGWVAHAPAVLFVTAPYYLAMIYATGGLGEFTAISMIPLALASGLSVISSDRLRLGPAAVLAASVILLTGSHNLTLVWGVTVLVIVGAVAVVVIPAARPALMAHRRGILRALGVAVPAVLVNGWFLLPDLVYASKTLIATSVATEKGQLQSTMYLVDPSHLWSLGRGSATPRVAHYALQLPVLAGAWILGGLVLARSAWTSSWYRGVLVLLAAIVVLYVLIERFGLLWGLPSPYNVIQFSYRLESYILLAVAGAVILVLRLAGRTRWTWVLGVVAAWSVVGAVVQLHQVAPTKAPEWTHAAAYIPPAPPPNIVDYGDGNLPVVTVDPDQTPLAFFGPGAEHGNRSEVTVAASPGAIVRSNIVAVSPLVKVEGGHFVAREPAGANLIQIADDATPGAAKLTVSAARPWPVVGGWLLTLAGLAGLVANAVVLVRRRARA